MPRKPKPAAEEWSAEDCAAVRGSSNFGSVGSQNILSGGYGPVVAVNAPTLIQTDVHPVTNVDLNFANILGSKNVGVCQQIDSSSPRK
ncbi:hypothetical protein [Paraburkholderia sediminicola]|uniref:hypothetical protein n=1 Tax=Paraburkholderia sediminicola TaxID=458836 RepID=UPI0038B84466